MQELRQIVERAQCDRATFGIIRRHAVGILNHLGIAVDEADHWLTKEIWNKKIADLGKWERELHKSLSSCGIYENLASRMEDRAKEWFMSIKPHLLRATTLDLGGGSGELANLIQNYGCNVTIADVLNWNKYNLPFISVRENKLEVPDGQFDQVVLLTVFHHTNDVPALVREVFRVGRKRVIFIESVTENLIGYAYGAWIDWFYNRVIHYSEDESAKINVPCNFLPATGWEQLVWKLTGRKPNFSENLGIFQYLNPENHHLFVYDK